MLRTLLSPRLLLSHLLVLTVVGGCVAASLWQWDRLAQVREQNEQLTARSEQPPVDLTALATADGVDPEGLEHRRAEATGTFLPEEEVLERNRNEPAGEQGLHLLTPLRLEDGATVLVRRGWVPPTFEDPPIEQAPAPTGRVTVTGVLEATVPQPTFPLVASDPEEGELDRVFHADTARLDPQVSGRLLPVVLRLAEPAPPEGELPVPAGSPRLDEGNHLSYAIQWASFALLAAGTYGVWLWRRLRAGTEPERAPAG